MVTYLSIFLIKKLYMWHPTYLTHVSHIR